MITEGTGWYQQEIAKFITWCDERLTCGRECAENSYMNTIKCGQSLWTLEIENTKFMYFEFIVTNTTASHWETTKINGSLVERCEMWGYHVDGCEGRILPGCDIMWSGRCLPTFRRKVPTLMADNRFGWNFAIYMLYYMVSQLNVVAKVVYGSWYIYIYIEGVPGGMCQTSGECSLS
jgi:hypothetical protein